jgi:hypothetical protein
MKRALVALVLSACSAQAAPNPAPTASLNPPPTASLAVEATTGPSDGGAADAEALESGAPSATAASDVDAGPPPPCPADMARVGRTCVDKWEAHLAAKASDGSLSPLPHNQRPPEDGNYLAVSEKGFYPQGYISRVESNKACRSAGKRLCSMSEWKSACRGPRGATFPYGGEHYQKDKCSAGKKHLLTIKFGPDARAWKYENFNDPSLNIEPGFLAKSGDYERCESASGVFDMVGNLHEWVSDTVDEDLIEKMEAEEVERHHQPHRDGNGVFLGGFFSNTEELGPGCKYITVAHEPTYHDYSTGFRCCKDADLPKPEKPAKKTKKK